MPFEYATSFPREAESALRAQKDSMKKCFSLLQGKNEREKINEGVLIVSSPFGDGYNWEIKISQEVKQMMREKAQSVISFLGNELIKKFEAFVSLESDCPGHSIEWYATFNSGETIIEMWDKQAGKAIATITEEKEFKQWLQYRRWL